MAGPANEPRGASPALIVVDVGNSAVKVVAFDAAGAVLSSVRAACGPGFRLPAMPPGVPVVAVSVSDRNLAALGREVPLLRPSAGDPPGTGIDRLCAATAAHGRAGGAAVAAGLGTAITVDAVDAAGRFLGGSIAPGVRAAAAGLTALAPALPAPDLAAGAVPAPGPTTAAALRSGHLLGCAGLVDRLIEEAARLAGKGAPVLLHGGDAAVLAPLLRTRVVAAPDLVAEGARLRFLAGS